MLLFSALQNNLKRQILVKLFVQSFVILFNFSKSCSMKRKGRVPAQHLRFHVQGLKKSFDVVHHVKLLFKYRL